MHRLLDMTDPIVYTCDECELKYFPHGTVGPMIHDAHVAIVHKEHLAVFTADGFEVVLGIVDGHPESCGVFCPHIEDD